MNNKIFLIGGGILLLTLGLLVPVAQRRVISYGVDAYAAHKPLYRGHTISETFRTENRMVGVGAILVDLRRSKNLTDVTVEIADPITKEVLASRVIPKESIRDDEFAYASFKDQEIPSHTDITITFRAEEAINRNAVGLRFDPDTTQLALSVMERVPVWRYIQTTIQNRSTSWTYVLFAIIGSLLCALAPFIRSPKGYVTALILVCIGFFVAASVTIPLFGGVSGGDAYNYLSISDTIQSLQNPFENTKRLPGYPLLLTPFVGSGMFDDQHVMRYVQVIASIWGLIMITCIARALKLSWPVALASAAILAFQKDYHYTALRPEPYSLYTAFLLTSVFLFFRSYQAGKRWQYILFGVALGYGAMVRQEGFVFAASIGACSVLYEGYRIVQTKGSWKKSLTRFAWMYVPALCLVAPFFIHNFFEYGHPFYTEYFEGDRLQIVDSFLAFQDAVGATWGVIASMWKPSWENLERLSLISPVFLSSAVLLWAWYVAVKRFHTYPSMRWCIIIVKVVAWISLIFAAIYLKPSIIGNFTIVSAAWTLAAIPIFLWETRWKGAVILFILITQALIATWFHPFPKHYQQDYPFIVLMVATALLSAIPANRKVVTATALAATTLPFFLIAVSLYTKFNAEIDRYNENVALDSVTYRAARAARTLPTPIGFDQAYLPARFYFDPDAKYFPDEDHPTPAMEQNWLSQYPLKTMVVTNANDVFTTIPSTWKKLQEFKAAAKDEEIIISTIYEIE